MLEQMVISEHQGDSWTLNFGEYNHESDVAIPKHFALELLKVSEEMKALKITKSEYDEAMKFCVENLTDHKFGSVKDCLASVVEEMKGLEERVKGMESKMNEVTNCQTWEAYLDSVRSLKKKLLEDLTRLKSRNEELEAENGRLQKSVQDWKETDKSTADYFQRKVDRLSASLAAAQEVLNRCQKKMESVIQEHEAITSPAWVENNCRETHKDLTEALSDPTGQLAFEKWKKMGAVVERAKLWWRLHRPIGWSVKKHHQTPKVNCGSDIEGNLALAVSNIEALDAKGDA